MYITDLFLGMLDIFGLGSKLHKSHNLFFFVTPFFGDSFLTYHIRLYKMTYLNGLISYISDSTQIFPLDFCHITII